MSFSVRLETRHVACSNYDIRANGVLAYEVECPKDRAAVSRMSEVLRQLADRIDKAAQEVGDLFEDKIGVLEAQEAFDRNGLTDFRLSNDGESAALLASIAVGLITLPRVPE